ncbi:50S ribosomal protein L24 [Candidatus Babeliales bacterium]|nr:50S ribosomal protein L24 [Candidatus Babeliales bacterium]
MLRKQDKVQVITGKDKGKVGEILELCTKSGRIKVKGVNLMTVHVKPRRQGEIGGIQKRESYINASNVMPVDAVTGKPVRVSKLKRT